MEKTKIKINQVYSKKTRLGIKKLGYHCCDLL